MATTSTSDGRVRALVPSLRLPAIAAPMTGASTPWLAAEACIAGIIGGFPTSIASSVAQLDEWCDEIDTRGAARTATAHPVGVALCELDRGQAEHPAGSGRGMRRAAPGAVGDDQRRQPEVIGPLREAGWLVLADVVSERYAHKALEAGADGLVLLSAGAGGHTGWANPFAFVRAVRAFYDGPLAVAGGMSDGVALWAAISAGYDLGLFETRFIATPVSGVSQQWRQALVDSTMDDVTLMTAANGVVASVIGSGAGSAGHIGAVHREMTVAEVVDDIEAGWRDARAAASALLNSGSEPT